MPDIDDQEAMPDDSGTDSQESPDTTNEGGYSIIFTVTPDGFRVSDVQPLAPEPQGDTEDEPLLPDLTAALKELIAIVKQNPIQGDVQKAFRDGFSQNEKKSTS